MIVVVHAHVVNQITDKMTQMKRVLMMLLNCSRRVIMRKMTMQVKTDDSDDAMETRSAWE